MMTGMSHYMVLVDMKIGHFGDKYSMIYTLAMLLKSNDCP